MCDNSPVQGGHDLMKTDLAEVPNMAVNSNEFHQGPRRILLFRLRHLRQYREPTQPAFQRWEEEHD